MARTDNRQTTAIRMLWRTPAGAALLTFLTGILISFAIGRIDAERHDSEDRSKAITELATVRARLEGVTAPRLSCEMQSGAELHG